LHGRYGTSDPGNDFYKVAPDLSCVDANGPQAGATANGGFWSPTNTAWVKNTHSTTGNAIQYAYIKYCCPTGT
jgi:hypothetical protein